MLDVKLKDYLGLQLTRDRGRNRLEPSVAEREPDRVGTTSQLVSDIVRGVEDSGVIVGPRGVQDGIADSGAIYEQLVVAHPADVNPGAYNVSIEGELTPKERRWDARRHDHARQPLR
jgi:hypothetical protein